jgi:uncharacterized protein YlxP (DUF503 family)
VSDGYVAVLVIHLHLPEAHSLKAKRSELNAVKAHLRNRVGLSVAEVDHQDVWQRSTLSAALVARSITQLEDTIDGVERYLDARFPDGARVERTLASVEELRG